MSAQVATNTDSIQKRLQQARFMKQINPFFLDGLNRDLDSLEKVEKDVSYALRGMLLAYQNDKKSIHYWDKAVNLNPIPLHYCNYGMSLLDLGIYDEALSKLGIALKKSNNDIGLLLLLRSAYSYLYAYNECKTIEERLAKLDKERDYSLHEKDILDTFFKGDPELMQLFGSGATNLISQYYSFKWITDLQYKMVEDRCYSKYMVKCPSDNDVLCVVECNSALSDFIIDFEDKHHLNLDKFYVIGEATE